jgi:hypothetical protein
MMAIVSWFTYILELSDVYYASYFLSPFLYFYIHLQTSRFTT